MSSRVRLSVVCLSSATFMHPTQPVKILGNVSTPFVPWPSIDICRKFYGVRPRGTRTATDEAASNIESIQNLCCIL